MSHQLTLKFLEQFQDAQRQREERLSQVVSTQSNVPPTLNAQTTRAPFSTRVPSKAPNRVLELNKVASCEIGDISPHTVPAELEHNPTAELDFQAFLVEMERAQDQLLESALEQPEPENPPVVPLPPRALSTLNRAQLEEQDLQRAQRALEFKRQAERPKLGGALATSVAERLAGQLAAPLCDEDRQQDARFQQLAQFVAPKAGLELDPSFHWKRAVRMLEPIRDCLGTAYRPLLTLVALASSVGRSPEEQGRLQRTLSGQGARGKAAGLEGEDRTFFAPLWEVASIAGISPDYLRKVLARHHSTLRCLFHHHDWKTKTTFTGEEKVLIAGCVFRLRWPEGETGQYLPQMLRGRKTRTVFRALTNRKTQWRDLDGDVLERHTLRAYQGEGKVKSNGRGKVKARTSSDAVPEDFALELLTYRIGQLKGLRASRTTDVSCFTDQLSRHHTLLSLLETPLERGHNKLEERVRQVAGLLCESLDGSGERAHKSWLQVCWTLYRTGHIGWLYQVVFDVLVRARDLGTVRSRGALVRYLLNARGYAELRAPIEAQQRAA